MTGRWMQARSHNDVRKAFMRRLILETAVFIVAIVVVVGATSMVPA